MITEQLSW